MSSYSNDPYVRPEGTTPEVDPIVVDPVVETPVVAGQPHDTATDKAKGKAKDAAASVSGPATDVKDSAVAAGKDVLATAKSEGGQVVDEAKLQGRRLLDESVSELRTQASSVQARLADTVQALTDELRAMADAPDANGPVAGLAHTGQQYGDRAASWLRDNDLDQALVGVRRYAARNPWTFLAVAGGAGLLVGRLARGLKDAGSPDEATYYQGQYRQGGDYRAVSTGQGYATGETLYGTDRLGAPQDPYTPGADVRTPRPGDGIGGREEPWGNA